MDDQHVYQHTDKAPRINVSVEKNSRGRNWTATVVDAQDVETAMALLKQVTDSLERAYGTSQTTD